MGFVIPEDFKSLDSEALAASVAESIEASASFADIADADLTDEQIVEMEALGNFQSEAQAELSAREAAATERVQRAAAARANFAKAPVEEAPAEEEEEPEAEASAEAVTASAGEFRRSAAALAAKAKKPAAAPAPARPKASLVAAANVSGFTAGHKFETLSDASGAIKANLASLPKGMPGARHRSNALMIQLPEGEFSQGTFNGNDDELFLAAASEARLSGGSLTAAGGWGAPSIESLDFCSLETTEGLIDVPEVTITRGGVRYTKGPSFADVLGSGTGFWDMTEATAEAGVEQKTFLRPTVPGFIEKRLDAVGVGVEAGLLLRQAWPELIARYSDMAITAHAHKMAAKAIAQIRAFTGAAVSVPNGYGNALDTLHILEVVALGERQRNFMSPNQTLEVLLPEWYKAAVRIDLANRTGVDLTSVKDATINAYFTERKMRVQWLMGYQPLTIGAGGVVTAFPTVVDAIMYPAGTYVRGKADVITLDTIYDSTNLKKNDYIELFVEQGSLMTNPCGDGRRISIPLAINGTTSAADYSGNFLVAGP